MSSNGSPENFVPLNYTIQEGFLSQYWVNQLILFRIIFPK